MKKFRKFLAVDRLTSGFVGALFAITLNVISNWITDNKLILSLLFLFLIIAGLLAAFLMPPKSTIVSVGSPVALRNETEYPRYARKGIIAFIPRYLPPRQAQANPFTKTDYLQEAKSGNWSAFSMEGSNFEPLIQAITTHKSKLQHCWLISTSGEDGSTIYVEGITQYLRSKNIVDNNVIFHYGTQYQIDIMQDDTEVVEKTRKMVDDIYKEADKVNISESEMISDITSGPRSLPFGMTLASLDDARDIEHMGTQYINGEPTGKPLPMIFHFEVRQFDKK